MRIIIEIEGERLVTTAVEQGDIPQTLRELSMAALARSASDAGPASAAILGAGAASQGQDSMILTPLGWTDAGPAPADIAAATQPSAEDIAAIAQAVDAGQAQVTAKTPLKPTSQSRRRS